MAAARLRTVRRAWLLGAAFGVVVAAVDHVPWVAEAGERYFGLPRPAAFGAAALLAAACAPVLGAGLGAGLWCATRTPRWPAVVMAGAVWAAWESVLPWVFPHYPWLSLAALQARGPIEAAQAACLAGAPGLSFLMASAGAALGLGLGPVRRGGVPRWKLLVAAPALVAATAAFGELRLALPAPAAPAACTLAGVDAEISTGALPAADVLGRYAAAADDSLPEGVAAVVWPESALPGNPQLDAGLLRRVRELAVRWDAAIVAGGPRTEWDAAWKSRRYNSVFRVDAAGPVEAYDKRLRVPFAEYWPFAPLPRPAALQTEEVSAGGKPGIFAAGSCRLGLLVCFEGERSEPARELARGGVHALVLVSNDAELPARAVEIEIAHARLRAIETGLPVLRVANRGGSVAIDRYGRIERRLRGGVIDLRPGTPRGVPANRTAGAFLLLCWGLAALSAGLAWRG